MIEAGTKLRLIKPIGGLKNIGEEFTVSEVNDGIIYFYSKSGDGCISTDEWNMYFREVTTTANNWANWYKEKAELVFDKQIIEFSVKVRCNDYGLQVKYKGLKVKVLVKDPDDFDYDELFSKACQKLFYKYSKNNVVFFLNGCNS